MEKNCRQKVIVNGKFLRVNLVSLGNSSEVTVTYCGRRGEVEYRDKIIDVGTDYII